MGDILQAATGWLPAYSYAAVLVIAFIDATGIPFPGRLALVAAGAFAAGGDASVPLLIGAGAAGVVVADHLWYFAGTLGGRRLLGAYCRLAPSTSDCAERAAGWLERFGPWVILVGRALAVVRMLAWPLARDHGVGYPTFLLLDVPAALVWTATWVGLGWALGDRFAGASDEVRWAGIALAVAAALAFALFALWRRHRRPAAS